MPIFKASSQVGPLYLGDKLIVQAYKGTELIYSSGPTENIYVFNTSLIADGSKTITLQKDTRGYNTSRVVTDWGDGTKDTLLTHTYAVDGEYTVQSKYGVNRSVKNMEVGDFTISLDKNATLNDYVTKSGLTYTYYKIIDEDEIDCYYSQITNSSDNQIEITYGGNIGYIDGDGGLIVKLGDTESFRIDSNVSNDSSQNIFPIYFINDENYTLENGCVLTPGVWFTNNSNKEEQRISKLSFDIATSDCVGSVNTRQSLVKVSGINPKQKNLNYMYYGCNSLKTVDISDLELWNFKNINSIEHMFKNCTNLYYFDITQWDLSTVQNTAGIFENSNLKFEGEVYFVAKDWWDNSGSYLESANSGSYDYYYKIATADEIPDESYLNSSGYYTYYNGIHFAAENKQTTYEEFAANSYELRTEVQDGVEKELLTYRLAAGYTAALITRTGFYDSTRNVTFTPGIWFYCSTKTYSQHGAILMLKELGFNGPDGPAGPNRLRLTFDPNNVDNLESFTVSNTTYYKITESIPDHKYIQGSGTITFYNTDSATLQTVEFDAGTYTMRQDSNSSSSKQYVVINTGSDGSGYTLFTMTPTGWYPNAGVNFTTGVWATYYVDGANPRYPVSIIFNGDGDPDWTGASS